MLVAVVGLSLTPATTVDVQPRWSHGFAKSLTLPFLAMSACAEFPAAPPLQEPPAGGDAGSDPTILPDTGEGDTDDADTGRSDAGHPPDTSSESDPVDPEEVPGELRFGQLDSAQSEALCAEIDGSVGLPAQGGMCEGRTVWPTGVDCEATLVRMRECGLTVGEYRDCVVLAREDACSLLHAPACEQVYACLGTGLDPAVAVGALSGDEYLRLCRWGVEAIGENREFYCDGIIRVKTHSVAECALHDVSACELSVREYEQCSRLLVDDICEVLHAPDCAPFRACFGPDL